MLKRFIREKIFSTKIDPERWLVLVKKGLRSWNLRVIGPEPLDVELVELTDGEAQDHALALAEEHFKAVNPRVKMPRLQQWRLALYVDRNCTT